MKEKENLCLLNNFLAYCNKNWDSPSLYDGSGVDSLALFLMQSCLHLHSLTRSPTMVDNLPPLHSSSNSHSEEQGKMGGNISETPWYNFQLSGWKWYHDVHEVLVISRISMVFAKKIRGKSYRIADIVLSLGYHFTARSDVKMFVTLSLPRLHFWNPLGDCEWRSAWAYTFSWFDLHLQ